MNRLSFGYPSFLMMIAIAPIPIRAADGVELTKMVISETLYESGNCVTYLRDINPAVGRVIMEDTRIMIQEDIVGYLTGRKTMIGNLLVEKKMQSLPNSAVIKQAKDRLKDKRDFEATFTGGGYNHHEVVLAGKRFEEMIGPSSKSLDTKGRGNYFKYLSCETMQVLAGTSPLIATYKSYEAYVTSHIESATIGYFDVRAVDNRIVRKVGTGNPYAEPKPDSESRFFIVDARFKNNDTESRLPFEGSLFINYNGRQYEFDSTEPIILEGYNIWFRKVNPLITVKTKIVYRIPNEIEGEVYWRPGRNKDDTQLWVGYVKAAK